MDINIILDILKFHHNITEAGTVSFSFILKSKLGLFAISKLTVNGHPYGGRTKSVLSVSINISSFGSILTVF
ncbi:MAG: hypothetical protein WCG25_08725 [bacterium]